MAEENSLNANKNPEMAMSSSLKPTALQIDGMPEKSETEHESAKSKEKKEKAEKVPFFKLFSFADSMDYLLMSLGTIGAVANGASMPLMTILFGGVVNALGRNANDNSVVHKVSEV